MVLSRFGKILNQTLILAKINKLGTNLFICTTTISMLRMFMHALKSVSDAKVHAWNAEACALNAEARVLNTKVCVLNPQTERACIEPLNVCMLTLECACVEASDIRTLNP